MAPAPAPAVADAEAEAAKKQLVRLRVTVEQLKGVPQSEESKAKEAEKAAKAAQAAAEAEAAPPPAKGKGGKGAPPPEEPEPEEEEMLLLAFSILGDRRTTKPVPRASVIDFEETCVEVEVARTPALRDQLIVHGIPFEVLGILPPPAPAEGEEGTPAEPNDTQEVEAEAAAELQTAPIGTITTHWGVLASGEAMLTQVCTAVIQPPAPEAKDKRRRPSKKEKLPPSYTLTLTATVAIIS